MNMVHVLFDPNGRITPRAFWIGVALIIGANIVSNLIPVLGRLIWLGLIYVGVCVYGKRLHDAGRSAWLHAIPWAVWLALNIAGGVLVAGPVLAAYEAGAQLGLIEILTVSAPATVFFSLALVVWIAYTVWVGIAASVPATNRYGPVPVAAPAAPAPAPDTAPAPDDIAPAQQAPAGPTTSVEPFSASPPSASDPASEPLSEAPSKPGEAGSEDGPSRS